MRKSAADLDRDSRSVRMTASAWHRSCRSWRSNALASAWSRSTATAFARSAHAGGGSPRGRQRRLSARVPEENHRRVLQMPRGLVQDVPRVRLARARQHREQARGEPGLVLRREPTRSGVRVRERPGGRRGARGGASDRPGGDRGVGGGRRRERRARGTGASRAPGRRRGDAGGRAGACAGPASDAAGRGGGRPRACSGGNRARTRPRESAHHSSWTRASNVAPARGAPARFWGAPVEQPVERARRAARRSVLAVQTRTARPLSVAHARRTRVAVVTMPFTVRLASLPARFARRPASRRRAIPRLRRAQS